MTNDATTITGETVQIEWNVPMTARDGTVLRSNVYRPTGDCQWPVLLTRIPYGKDNPPRSGFHADMLDPAMAASRGYIVVVQDVRGTGTSDGEFRPFKDEYEDGADALGWAAKLAGSNGRIGMYGGSYFGHTQFAAAVDADGSLQAMIPRQRCADPHNGMYFRQGAFELTMQTSWYLAMALGEAGRRLGHDPERLAQVTAELVASNDALAGEGYRHRPLDKFAPLHGKPLSETFFAILEHPMDSAPLDTLRFANKYDRVTVPALHIGGWYDIFLQQTIDDYMAMRRRGIPAKLLIGPGAHGSVTMNPVGERVFGLAASDLSLDLTDSVANIQLRWFDRWLKDEQEQPEDPNVRVFVMGENQWRAFDEWPPKATEMSWHLQPGGKLSPESPVDSAPDCYTFDPENPAPTLGGSIMSDPAHLPGVFDQRPVEGRPDVLTFTSEPLEEDLHVVGHVTVRLWAETDVTDTDFVVRLCDVEPDGRSLNITDGIVRAQYRDKGGQPSLIEPGVSYEYDIDLWSTANVFRKGHRVRVQVTSSNFPRWDANPNTGTPFSSSHTVLAHQQILHDPEHPSRIILPVLSQD